MATRQERMRDRMRGAGRHNVGDIDFGFIIPVAEEAAADEPEDEPEDPPAVEASPPAEAPAEVPATTRPTPNTSAKRKRINRDESSLPDAPPPPPPATTQRRPPAEHQDEDQDQDQPMADAPPLPTSAVRNQTRNKSQRRPRGPLSSVISATKRLSFDPSSPPPPPPPPPPTNRAQEGDEDEEEEEEEEAEAMEVTESPADAPGSGRRRPLRLGGAGTPVVGSSVLLQKVLADLDDDDDDEEEEEGQRLGGGANSSPVVRRVARRRAAARASVESVNLGSPSPGAVVVPGRGSRRSARLSGSSVAESEVVSQLGVVVEESTVQFEEEEEEVVEESIVQFEEEKEEEEEGEEEVVEESIVQPEEEEEAEEVGEKEAAQRLGRERPRRGLRSPSPELGSGVAEESPAPKRRRRREAASPAQQQQPAKKARVGRLPARPQPRRQPSPPPQRQPQAQAQAKPKPKAKKQAKKSKAADDQDEEEASGSVPVTVQRFTKPPRPADAAQGDENEAIIIDPLNGEIPFANPGGVNAVDVLSKLCEELVEAYMDKLETRARAAEDAATRREQKTMYRTLEAFQEELRTRLLEHTIALDTLHALRKRVRAAQKEKLALREEILRVRAEREQVALRMDAIRIRHEADSKEALRHISLSSAMHNIDLAVEKGQAAAELSPAEQKKADLANLELLISRVADQACTRSDGGGTLKQIREFNAFLERAATVLEGR
ncbi:hypothetical protein C8A00DRAFT_35681 [Chaetomidium leptoderma]|uniref:Inner kinetochore subunit AME1 domain-containing protein n=1 Tax=Chaetomidium leptoderma TaxID=669021 RepID=A0AAN6VK57_9PEZI|nr:hypothetical protein C8A00DRAFT_35681 [Chaetomidium leptoderma]